MWTVTGSRGTSSPRRAILYSRSPLTRFAEKRGGICWTSPTKCPRAASTSSRDTRTSASPMTLPSASCVSDLADVVEPAHDVHHVVRGHPSRLVDVEHPGDVPGFSPSHQRVHLRCVRSEEHTSELQSQSNLVCRLLL